MKERPPDFPMAIYDPAGALVFLSLSPDEDHIWTWFMGWPDKAELEAKKALGYVCRPVNVSKP